VRTRSATAKCRIRRLVLAVVASGCVATPAPPRIDRWQTIQGNAAVQVGGAGADYGGVAYLGWAGGALDPDQARPAVERSRFWGVGLELTTNACTDDECRGRTGLGPAVRAGIAWVRLPLSMAHVYVQASGLFAHEHGRDTGIQGAGVRGSAGVSVLPLLASSPLEDAAVLVLSHIEVSFEAYRPSGGSFATGLGAAFGLGF